MGRNGAWQLVFDALQDADMEWLILARRNPSSTWVEVACTSSRANLTRVGKAKARFRERGESIRPVGIGPRVVEHSEVEGIRFEKVK
jgi:hypothetical protein